MRIDKIEIDGFGKLNNFSVTLESGFNLIFGENESGKSTLCAFLLSMFYELPNDVKRLGLSESVRRKYKPWNTERFGGRVYFTHEEKQYILEKTFGATKRSDRARLLDAAGWDECGSAENVGERFFGLGREGFLKTLYITGLGAEAKETGSEEILTRLSNLETSGSEDVSYAAIQNALEKERFAILTKTGKGGRLASLKEKKQRLEAELISAERFYASIKKEENRAAALKMQIAEFQTSYELAEKIFQTARAHEVYLSHCQTEETRAMLSNRLESEKRKASEINRTLEELLQKEHSVIKEEAADEAKRLERDLIILESKKAEKEKRLSELSESLQAEELKKNRLMLPISVAVFTAFALAGCFLRKVLNPAVLLCVGALSAAVAFIVLKCSRCRSNGEGETAGQELENVKCQVLSVQEKIQNLCRAYNVDGLTALFARIAEERAAEEKRREVKSQSEKCAAEIKLLEESLQKLPEMRNDEFESEVINYSGDSATELDMRQKQLKASLEALKQEHYELSVDLAKQSVNDRDISDISSEILTVTEQINNLEKQHTALLKAAEWLERAHDEIRQNYAPRLNKKTAELFARLTSSKYVGVKLGAGFRLNYQNENNEIVDAAYLSGGTYDLLYIALKLASLNVLFGENIPPIILDDALLQLDDERLTAMADFMITGGDLGQVIYFTCHKESAKLFKHESIHRIEI